MGRRDTQRILLIGDYPPPMGGISVHVQQLHQAMRRAGVSCKVMDISKTVDSGPEVRAARSYRRFGQELLWHASQGWLMHLHTAGNNPKAWVVALAVATAGRMFRTPTLLTVHSGQIPEQLPAEPAIRLWAKLALGGFSHVVTVSDAVREALLTLGAEPTRITTYPAFCSSEVVPGDPPERLAGVRVRRRPLLSVAHHPFPVYGRSLIFEALSMLIRDHPRIGLAVFGPGTETAEFRADAERFGVTEFLEDLGELEHSRALAVIRASDVFVRPTTADGDSLSVREALTLGVPCVASDAALRPPGTRVYRTGDPADLARKIDEALKSSPTPMPQPDTVAFLRELYDRFQPAHGPVIPIAAAQGQSRYSGS